MVMFKRSRELESKADISEMEEIGSKVKIEKWIKKKDKSFKL